MLCNRKDFWLKSLDFFLLKSLVGIRSSQRMVFPGVHAGAEQSPIQGAQHLPGQIGPPQGAPMGANGSSTLP